jgi:hypothetical protein
MATTETTTAKYFVDFKDKSGKSIGYSNFKFDSAKDLGEWIDTLIHDQDITVCVTKALK